jgi:glycosyltransferase involved in cell wall biosynthesis
MSPITILSAYYKHKPGGFTKRLYRAYRGLDAAGYRVIYVATEKLPVEGNNIQAALIPMRSKPSSLCYWPELYLRTVWEMRRLTKEEQAHCHLMFSSFYASISILAGWGIGARTLTFLRADNLQDARQKRFAWLREKVHWLLELFSVHYSWQVIAISDVMGSIIGQHFGGQQKTRTLPNDITTRPLKIGLPDIPGDRVRIVTVSVLTPMKNLKLMLEALSRLPQRNWEYLLVGCDTSDGDYQGELQRFTEQAGIAGQVKFLGWQDDVASIVQTCHLFVFPTLSEGSPNALLEAMGYGLPCLASDIPEIREILPDSELLFSPKQPDELTVKLERFMTQQDYAGLIMEKTLKHTSRYVFDWEHKVVQLVADISRETD